MAKNILLRKGKRLLSVVLALAVAGSYMPTGFGVKKAYAHASGEHNGYTELTQENAYNFHTAISSDNGLKEGKYYLAGNINENQAGYSQSFCVVGDVTICMNGKQLSLTDTSVYPVLATVSNDTKHQIEKADLADMI